MATAFVFPPPRRQGIFLLVSVSLILLGAGAVLFIQALRVEAGIEFIGYILGTVILFAPLPVILFRLYALVVGSYSIERDGLHLRWGLRVEDLPMTEIEWVRPASDLVTPLPRPFFALPGALVGIRNVRDLGPVEFLASTYRTLLLVATPNKVYCISPADPSGFLRTFHRTSELGSLAPIAARSVYPTFLLSRVWADRLARALLLGGLGMLVVVFVAVSLIIPTRAGIPLGFLPDGTLSEPGPAIRLLLLPILAAFCLAADMVAGLFFYRVKESQMISYLLWGSGALTATLMLAAVFFIISA